MDDLLLRGWELALRGDGVAQATRQTYLSGAQHFLRWLQRPAASATRTDIREWLAGQREQGTPTSSIAIRLKSVRYLYRWAHSEGDVEVDPAAGIRAPAVAEAQTPILDTDAVRALLAGCAGKSFIARRDYAILSVLADTGIRRSECAGIHLIDIDSHTGGIVIRGKGANREGKRLRTVMLGTKSCQSVNRYLRLRERHAHASLPNLWLSHRGALDHGGIYQVVKRRARAAGINEPITPHWFRHKWADNHKRNGGRDDDLMILAGWRNRKTLERYGKAGAQERAIEAAKRLSFGDQL